ncbi:MAG: 30S ribosomal protein S14 [Candidatus Acidifodinimicrobium sp.]
MENAYERILNSLQNKPVKRARMMRFNKPKERPYGLGKNRCVRCNRHEAHIKIHGLNYCRECFKEVSKEMGFKKYGKEV